MQAVLGFGLFSLAVLAALAAGLVVLRRAEMRRAGAETRATVLSERCERLEDRLFELAESEERHRSLVEAQGDLIVRRDAAGRILFANAAYAALLGRHADDLTGLDLEPELGDVLPPVVLPDGTRLFDARFDTPAGERWISWAETRVPDPAGRLSLQRVGRDVTARVAIQAELEQARARAIIASEAKSRFLATVSHEFRTPLNGILGMSDLLFDTELTPEQVTYVRALRTSGEHLLAQIEDILDFAKVEAGRTTLADVAFDLGGVLENTVEFLAPRAHEKGLSISVHLSPALPALVRGDPERVRQIAINLVGNAIKFTAHGGIAVTVGTGDDGLVLRVRDTGPGIALDRQEAIFAEFEQADAETGKTHGGTGLGLAITHRLVLLMGGRISVTSAPGEGALFEVVLPLPAAGDEEQGARAAEQPDLAGQSVLVVSGSPFDGDHWAMMVRDAGGRADLRTSREAALVALMSGQWDAVLVDLALGDDAAREIAILARACGLGKRLVLLSALDRRRFGAPAEAGYSGFLVKPVRARSLRARLAEPDRPASSRDASGLRGGLAASLSTSAAPAQGRPRVLLAEDNQINALLARRTLEKLGAEPVWARDGQEAVDLMLRAFAGEIEPFVLGLFDVRMPVLDGHRAARRIRDEESALGSLSRVPLIAITANVSGDDRQAALAAGFDDCLPKPLVRDQLAGWLATVATDRAA